MTVKEVFESQAATSYACRQEPVKNRVRRLKGMRDWILAHRSDIRAALSQDLGKSPEEADLTEILVVLADLRSAIRNVRYWAQPETASRNLAYLGTKGRIHFEPKGRVAIISPWNYPFSLCVLPMISALAAGNTLIVKPSEFAPKTSELINRMVTELFASDQVWVCQGGAEASKEILELPWITFFLRALPEWVKLSWRQRPGTLPALPWNLVASRHVSLTSQRM